MRLLLLIILLFIPFTAHAQQTIVVPAGGSIQSALNAAQCGDRIVLTASKDGGVYKAPADFVAYELNKSCPKTAPITITSSVTAPTDGTRVTLANRSNMPKLIARVGSPGFFDIQTKASGYRFSHLWFTNEKRADLSGTSYLIGGGGHASDVNAFASNIEIDHCFFNPVDWDEDNNNLRSSVNYAIEVAGSNVTVRDSHMTGFGAKYANSDTLLDGGCVLIGTSPGPYTMDNNHCEAWFVGFFVGGGDPGTANHATVTASTTTSLTLSQTANLQPGDYISYRVPQDHLDNPTRAAWGASIVDSVSGSSVTLKIPTQVIGTNDNKRNGPPALVGTGSDARWRGWIPSDIRITHNTFFKPKRWFDYVGTDGKGFFEIKLCDRCLIDGNVFDGRTGMTITVRNQGGAAAWSIIKNLTVSNNYFPQFSVFAATLFDDNQQLSMPSSNIQFVNNLVVGDTGPEASFGIRPKVFTGQHGDLIIFDHNTVLQSGEIGRSGSGNPQLAAKEQMTNWRWTNNITNWGTGEQYGFACLNSTNGSNEPCMPGYVWTKSVMIGAPTGPLADRRSMANFPSGNWNPATAAEVKFTDPANGDYSLRVDSPYKNAGTDGKDIGVDMVQLRAHLGGAVTAPLPTPTPVVSPSPIASPSPVVTPTPVASPSPLPSPSPQPTATPSGTTGIQGYVYADGIRIPNATVSVAGKSTSSREDAYFWWDDGIPLGSVIEVVKIGYEFPRVTVIAETVDQLYFVSGRKLNQPTPSPTVPPPTPSPTATPSPVPSPTAQPTPIPTPTIQPTPQPSPPPAACEMAIVVPVMAEWSTGVLRVSIMSPVLQSFTLTATPDTGQLTVTPRSQSFVNVTSITAMFKLQSKKKSASVVVSGPCGAKTVQVIVQ